MATASSPLQLFTECTHCGAVLQVTVAQLRDGAGKARCGTCEQVFDALLNLREPSLTERLPGHGLAVGSPGDPLAGAAPPAAQDIGPGGDTDIRDALFADRASARDDDSVAEDYRAADDSAATASERWNDADDEAPGTASDEHAAEGSAETEAEEKDDDGTRIHRPGDTPPGNGTRVWPSGRASETRENTRFDDLDVDGIDDLPELDDSNLPPLDEAPTQISPGLRGGAFEHLPPLRTARDTDTELPALSVGADVDSKDRGPERAPAAAEPPKSRTGLYAALAAVLAVLLALQVIVFESGRLLSAFPQARPLVDAACAALPCRREAAGPDLGRFRFESLASQAHETQANALSFSATLHNDADDAQPLPDIELLLFDATGNELGRGRFAPAEYLDAASKGVTDLEAGMSVDIDIGVRRPEGEPTSFELSVR